MALQHWVQGQDYKLAGSGITSTTATIVLQTMLLPNNSTQITFTDFGTTGYAVLEPGTVREENISFTGLTQNANGTATLSGVLRGLNFVSPYTSLSSLKIAHAGGTIFRLSNTAQFYTQFANVGDNQTITGLWTFPSTEGARPRGNADTDTAVLAAYVTFGQLSRTVAAGASNASTILQGLVQLATQSQVDAKTLTGSTGAKLVATPDLARSTLLNDYKADTGIVNALVITPDPAITAYVVGQQFSVLPAFANTTTTPTIAVNGGAAKTITKYNGLPLEANDLITTQIANLEYNGTTMQLLNPANLQVSIQNGLSTFATTTGAANAYVLTLSPAITGYVSGQTFRLKVNFTNTGPATVAVSGLAATPILINGFALTGGELVNGATYTIAYDGTNFQLQSQSSLVVAPLLYSSATAVNVNNTATETTLATMSLVGNALGATSAIKGRFFISLLQNTSGVADTLTFAVKYGGTTIATTVLSTSTTSLNILTGGYLDFLIIGAGATNSQVGSVTLIIGGSTGVYYGGVVAEQSVIAGGSGTAAVDSTTAQTLALTAKWGTAQAAALLTMSHGIIELVK